MLRIRELRLQKKILQKDMAKELGIPANTFNQYEKGRREPDLSTLSRIASYLGVSVDYLLGNSDLPNAAPTLDELISRIGGSEPNDYPVVAVIGSVRAGYGGIAYEELLGYEMVTSKNTTDCFYLLVKGDSMEPRIHDGDLALVRKQEDVDSGDLAVVILNGYEGTLKKVIKAEGSVILQPFNPDYPPEIISGERLNELRIVGKVIRTITRTEW